MRKSRFIILFIINIFLTHFIASGQQNQTFTNGESTAAINFPGKGCVYTWVNSNPSIGLSANGSGNIASFTAINNSTLPVTATIKATPQAAEFAYIANEGDGTVSVINTITNEVVAVVTVGNGPFVCALNPNGKFLYVANTGLGYTSTVSVINTATNTVINTFFLNYTPYGMAVSPDGSKVYVSTTDGVITVFDGNGINQIGQLNLATYCFGIAISPNSNFLYIAEILYNDIAVIDLTTLSRVATVMVGIHPWGVLVSPDGNFAYTTNQASNDVSVIDTKTNLVIATIPVGKTPFGLAFSPDGSLLYIANSDSNSVSVINTVTNTVLTTITVGISPIGVCLNPDGSKLYVTNKYSNNVSVINTATNAITSTIPAGLFPDSYGTFISGGTGCSSTPITFTITVNPTQPNPSITADSPKGSITACLGQASASPDIQQFAVAGSDLTQGINVMAPEGFEVSLNSGANYSSNLTVGATAGSVNSQLIYVRAANSAPTGSISGNVILSSPGAVNKNVFVKGFVIAPSTLNSIASQTVGNGNITNVINFTGTGEVYKWTNDKPGIGLAASGTGNIAAFVAVNTANSPVTATITVTPQPAPIAYINNSADGTVVAVNTVTNATIAKIPVGTTPIGVAVSPDGSRVYVENEDSNTISVINTASNTVIATIDVGPFARGGMCVSPDGSRLYFATFGGDNFKIINTVTNMVVATIPAGHLPLGTTISPDGSKLYIANFNDGTVSVFNTLLNTFNPSIKIGATSGAAPIRVAIAPDGSKLYVVAQNPDAVYVIDAITNQEIAVVPIGLAADNITISPDGSKVYAVSQYGNAIYVISTVTNSIIATIPVADGPVGISLTPDGGQIYITSPSAVSVINASTNKVISIFSTGNSPHSFGDFIVHGQGCSGIPESFNITVNPTPIPVITITGAPAALSTVYGAASVTTSFVVAGAFMTNNIQVMPPKGFEISSDGIVFKNNISLGTTGSIGPSTIFLRLSSVSPVGDYSGNIVLTSQGITSVNVPTLLSTVTPAPLKIVADDKIKKAGIANPALTVTYYGFVNGEGFNVLTQLPQITTTATLTSGQGVYPILVSGALSPNYSITYSPGTLTIIGALTNIVVPNTFTPNGDGINDFWEIKSLANYPDCEVSIFSRYGNLIYHSIGYSNPWAGTYNSKPLPTGTYYYIIDPIKGLNGLSGYVTILR